MNFIPAFRSTRFKMSRVLTIVIALAVFGASFATSSSLYAQLARYSKDGGTPIVSADRVTKALTQGTPSLAVGDYVTAQSGARHGATFIIPGGADFTIQPENAYVSIDLTTVGNGSAFRFEDKESNATLNLTNLDYWGGGSGGNNVFLHMDSGENNFLTLNLNNATIYSMKGVISSGNSNSKVKINSNRSLSLFSNVSFGFGNWDNGNGQPVKVDITFTNENSSFTLSNNTRGVCGSVAFTSGFTSTSSYVEIKGNRASNSGGAIYATGNGNVSLTANNDNLRIQENTATTGSGGFLYSDSSGNINIASSKKISLTYNTAPNASGGMIYNIGNGNIDIVTPDNEIYVSNNVAGNNGGMIYNRGEAAAKITFDANKVTVTDNLANNGSGGVIYNEGASMDIKAVAEMTFKRNYASAGNGGAIYSGDYNDPAENVISIIGTNNLTISNNYAGYVPGDNPSAPYWNADGCKGGAIYSTAKKLLITLNAVEGSTNAKLTFENNFATGDGGAIYNAPSATRNAALTIQGDCDSGTVTISRNKAGGSGGAIYNANAEIDMNSKNKMSIQDNKADGSGGAIYNSSPDYDFTLKSIALDINSNSAQENGGAIYLKSKTNLINGTNLNLKYNVANGSGGAIYEVATSGGSTRFQALDNIAITDNIANTGSGGAIYRTAAAGASEIGDLSFYANKEVVLNRNYAENDKGGAIYNDAQSNIDFESNRVLSIKNNKAINGGAIYQSGGGVAFKGSVIQDNPQEANFFNNVATGDESTLGEALANDIFCSDKLSFVGEGVYTFNGGIYAGSTSISAADVTVYGREFLPGTQTPDTTNHFRFNATTISNDGKLTVQFDEIEDHSGVFTLEKKTENATMLEWNTETKTRQLTMEQSKLQVLGNGVVEKTGDGVLQIVSAAQGLVEAENFIISSGRVDFAGWVKATMKVKENATFSPGSFDDADLIGKAYVIGDVQIEDSGTTLFEFGTFPGNKEDVDHHDVLSISNGSFVFDPSDSGLISLEFLKGDEGSWAINKCWYLLVDGANVEDGDYTYLLRNAGPFNLVGAGGNLYLTSYVIPEPSTWALMILGAVGLLYWRRKAVKK